MALKWVDSIKSGSPEVETIRRHSQGEEAPEGGLTQWLIPGTRFSPEIWRELEGLSPGEWTKTPYRLRGKATLLKLEDRIPSEPLPLESCRGRILKEIAEVRMRLATRKLSHEILEENKFKACEETLNSLAPVQVP